MNEPVLPDRIGFGVIGEPGQRTFYLQARAADLLVTLKMEKSQVQALAERLGQMLVDLARPGHLPDDTVELEPFTDADFVVGTLALAYDEGLDRVIVVAEGIFAGELGNEDEVHLVVTREQASALAIQGTLLARSGRPPCPLCGFPLDPRGHACPRTNGHHPPIL